MQTADGPDPAHAAGQPRELKRRMRVMAHAEAVTQMPAPTQPAASATASSTEHLERRMRVMAHAEAVAQVPAPAQPSASSTAPSGQQDAPTEQEERYGNDPFWLSDEAWRACGKDAHELPDELWHAAAWGEALEGLEPATTTTTGPQSTTTTQPQSVPTAAQAQAQARAQDRAQDRSKGTDKDRSGSLPLCPRGGGAGVNLVYPSVGRPLGPVLRSG